MGIEELIRQAMIEDIKVEVREEVIQEVREEVIQETLKAHVKRMLSRGFSIEDVSSILDIPSDSVAQWARESA